MRWLRRLRYRWQYRGTQVVSFGDHKFRITKFQGKIIGIEHWSSLPKGPGYGYTVWRKGTD